MNLSRTTTVSYTVFFDAIAAQGRALLRVSLDLTDASLTPPQSLLTHVQDLRAILALHTAEADDAWDEEAGGSSNEETVTIERALDTLVDPAVKMCVAAAEEKDATLRRRATSASTGAAAAWDRPVFVLNCLTYLVDTLVLHPCAARKRAELDGVVEARVRELIEEHVRDPHFISSLIFFSHARFICICSTRTSCAIRACTTPSAHANKFHKTTYVSLFPFLSLSFLPVPAFCSIYSLKHATMRPQLSGTSCARASLCAPRTSQRALLIRALARLARRSARAPTRRAHGTRSTRTSAPRGTAASRARIRGAVHTRARAEVAV